MSFCLTFVLLLRLGGHIKARHKNKYTRGVIETIFVGNCEVFSFVAAAIVFGIWKCAIDAAYSAHL